ncbi:MAG: kelch repeat-containing protein [Candidatus Coatesbacteria bacterium]
MEAMVRFTAGLLCLGFVFCQSAYATDPVWSSRADMGSRGRFAAVTIGGTLYVMGGLIPPTGYGRADTQAYDPATDTWVSRANMKVDRAAPAAAAVGGRIYVVGGYDFPNTHKSAETYDPATDTWVRVADMSTPRAFPVVAAVNGKIYAIGGTTDAFGGGAVTTVEMYDPATDTWTPRAGTHGYHEGSGAAVVDGIIYVVGGWSSTTMEAYDPATDTWEIKAGIPTPRWEMGVATVNCLVYAVGGSTTILRDTVEVYDPQTGAWSVGSSLPSRRVDLAAAVIGCTIYALGGATPGASGYVGTNAAGAVAGENCACLPPPPPPPPYSGPVRVFPNPFQRGRAVRGTVKFDGIPAGAALRLYTVRGVRVWETESKGGSVEWDGKGLGGGPVSPGVYLWVADDRGKRQTGKLVVE